MCAMVSDFWSVRCHYECILDLDCGFRSLVPAAPGSPRTAHSFLYRWRWPAARSLVNGMQQLVGRAAVTPDLQLTIAKYASELTASIPTAMLTPCDLWVRGRPSIACAV